MKIVRVILGIVSLLILAAVLWKNSKTDKSNDLIKEAAASIEVGNGQLNAMKTKVEEIYGDEAVAEFPGNREKISPTAAEVADGVGKVAEAYRQAAAKFELAAAETVDDVVAENLRLRQQWVAKMAEAKTAYQKVALLMTDESIKDNAEFLNKRDELLTAAEKLDKEADALFDKFKQHRDAHGDKFE